MNSNLTPRELEYVVLACRGGSIKEHAEVLGISIKTAEKHRSKATTKISRGAHNSCTVLLIFLQYAIKNGHIKVEEWLETKIS